MLQELSHMDRITQLQDEIQQASSFTLQPTFLAEFTDLQLLMIMSNTVAYLISRSTFLQVSPDIPVTKQRNSEKYDPPEVFEGLLSLRDRC